MRLGTAPHPLDGLVFPDANRDVVDHVLRHLAVREVARSDELADEVPGDDFGVALQDELPFQDADDRGLAEKMFVLVVDRVPDPLVQHGKTAHGGMDHDARPFGNVGRRRRAERGQELFRVPS